MGLLPDPFRLVSVTFRSWVNILVLQIGKAFLTNFLQTYFLGGGKKKLRGTQGDQKDEPDMASKMHYV